MAATAQPSGPDRGQGINLWSVAFRPFPYLGSLLAEKPNLAIAGAFYLVYVVGLIALAVWPSLQEGSVLAAAWRAALFGLLAYATYDLTNLATIQGWAWQVSVADMIWGTFVSTVTTIVSYYAGVWLGLVAK